MKKLLLALLLLLPFVTNAQQRTPIGTTNGYVHLLNSGLVDTVFAIPIRDTVNWNYETFRKLGRLTIRPQNGKFYYHNLTKWVQILDETDNTGSTPDSNVYATVTRLQDSLANFLRKGDSMLYVTPTRLRNDLADTANDIRLWVISQGYLQAEVDGDITNELQSLTNNKVGNIVTINISGGAGTAFSVADGDSVATNELQNLSFNAGTNVLAISGGNSVVLPYLQSYTETDPTVPAWVKAILQNDIDNWNDAYSWGNHGTAGYEVQTNKNTTSTLGNSSTIYTSELTVKSYVDAAIANLSTVYAPIVHTHAISDVTGLTAALASKVNTSDLCSLSRLCISVTGPGLAYNSATGVFTSTALVPGDTINKWVPHGSNEFIHNQDSTQQPAKFRIAGNAYINIAATDTFEIDIFGNSIETGYGLPNQGDRWPTLMCKLLDMKENNHAVAGGTLAKRIPIDPIASPNMVDNIPAIPYKTANKKKLFFIYLLNDIGVNAPDYDTTNCMIDYNRVIDSCFARGWTGNDIIIGTTTYKPGTWGTIPPYPAANNARQLAFNTAITNMINARGLVLFPAYNITRNFTPYSYLYQSDSLHLNELGNMIMAQNAAAFVASEIVKDGQALAVNGKVEMNELYLRMDDSLKANAPYMSLVLDSNGKVVGVYNKFIENNPTNVLQPAFVRVTGGGVFGNVPNFATNEEKLQTTGVRTDYWIATGAYSGSFTKDAKIFGAFDIPTQTGIIGSFNHLTGVPLPTKINPNGATVSINNAPTNNGGALNVGGVTETQAIAAGSLPAFLNSGSHVWMFMDNSNRGIIVPWVSPSLTQRPLDLFFSELGIRGTVNTYSSGGFTYLVRNAGGNRLLEEISNIPASTLSGTVSVSNGGTGVSSLTPYAVLAGGTTGTGAVQQVSGVGTSGYVLTSNGAGALPTWQAPTGGGGGSGTVTDFIFTDGGGFDGTVNTSTTTPMLSLALQSNYNFVTDAEKTVLGNTSGTNTGDNVFNANDFNTSGANVTIDYVNGQQANGSQNGFLSSSNYTNFLAAYNDRIVSASYTAGLLTLTQTDGGTVTAQVNDATTGVKGIAVFDAANFAIASGNVTIKMGGVGATELASTTVTPGSYTNANFTVDADGRVTAASNGAGGGGTPGTPANSIQWNSSSTFAGANRSNIQQEGFINLRPATAATTVPDSGVTILSREYAGEYLPVYIADGEEMPLGADHGFGRWGYFSVTSNSTGLGSVSASGMYGGVSNLGGTLTNSTWANTNQATKTYSLICAPAGGAGNGSGVTCSGSRPSLFFGNTTNSGGFRINSSFSLNNTASSSRLFIGAAAVAPTNADPSSFTNIIGVGKDAGDANLQIMYNDGSGTATKVSLGVGYDAAAVYLMIIAVKQNTTNAAVALYKRVDGAAGYTIVGSPAYITTNTPAVNTTMQPYTWVNTGTAGAATDIRFIFTFAKTKGH